MQTRDKPARAAIIPRMDTLTLRDSRDTDIADITAIYAHAVIHGFGSFEVDPPSI